jgi:hypothetical protein
MSDHAVKIKRENLWFGTIGGISMFNGTDWVRYDATNSVVSGTIGKIIEYDSKLYAITFISPQIPQSQPPIKYNSGTIYRFDGSNWEVFISSSQESFTDLAFDSKNIAWITTIPNGLICYDGKQAKYFNRNSGHLLSDSLWSIKIDNEGNKWLGTWKIGLLKFKDTMTIGNYRAGATGLCSDFVRCMYFDKFKNTLLIGSWDRCITRLNLNNLTFEGFGKDNSGLNLDMIEGITEYGGRYWICSQSLSKHNNGAYSWDGRYSWINYKPSANVWCVAPYKSQQKIILGTPIGAFLYDLPNANNENLTALKKFPFKVIENTIILLPEQSEVKLINIYNLSGQLAKQIITTPHQTKITLADLGPSLYILECENRTQLIVIN